MNMTGERIGGKGLVTKEGLGYPCMGPGLLMREPVLSRHLLHEFHQKHNTSPSVAKDIESAPARPH